MSVTEPVQDSGMAEDDAGMLQQVDVDAATVVVNGGLHFRQMNVGVLERVFHRPEFKNVSRLVCDACCLAGLCPFFVPGLALGRVISRVYLCKT